jgi:hypothetical protein
MPWEAVLQGLQGFASPPVLGLHNHWQSSAGQHEQQHYLPVARVNVEAILGVHGQQQELDQVNDQPAGQATPCLR